MIAVAIDVNFGEGFKVMTIDEWTSAWKVSRHPVARGATAALCGA